MAASVQGNKNQNFHQKVSRFDINFIILISLILQDVKLHLDKSMGIMQYFAICKIMSGFYYAGSHIFVSLFKTPLNILLME